MLAKFACANLAAKFSPLKLLNSWVVIYLSWLWSVSFFTKLLTLGILFSTAARAVVVAKLVISGILSLIFFI